MTPQHGTVYRWSRSSRPHSDWSGTIANKEAEEEHTRLFANTFGFHTQHPAVTFGDTKDDANELLFQAAANMRVPYVRLSWNRAQIQRDPANNLHDNDWSIVRQNVRMARRYGLKIIPTIHLGNHLHGGGWSGAQTCNFWYGGEEPDQGVTSECPFDYDESALEVGRSESVMQFFLDLFKELEDLSSDPDTIPYVAVGNEQNSSHFWRGWGGNGWDQVLTPARQYLAMLRSAREAIGARENPTHQIRLIDGGMASEGWGWVIGRELALAAMERGRPNAVRRIARWVHDYNQTTDDWETPSPSNEIEYRLLNDPVVISAHAFRMAVLRGAQQYVDCLNFHFYERQDPVRGLTFLSDVVTFLRRVATESSIHPPRIVCHELGDKDRDDNTLEHLVWLDASEEHATHLRLKMDAAYASGLEMINWFSARHRWQPYDRWKATHSLGELHPVAVADPTDVDGAGLGGLSQVQGAVLGPPYALIQNRAGRAYVDWLEELAGTLARRGS